MQNAIITGGAQGIGLAISKQLLQDGFNVAILDIQQPDHLNDEVLAFMSEHPQHVFYYQFDLKDIEQHQNIISQVIADIGDIHCLVNNAGIAARPLTDILDLSPQAFDLSIDINLKGTFFLTQFIAKHMLQQSEKNPPYRSIIFITSIAANLISTNRSQYCISKSALSTTAKIFARKLAEHSIFVHEIRPGFIKTAMTASLGRTAVDEWIEEGRVPMQRWGDADEIAQTASTLASGKLPFMSGNIFWVDGGLTLHDAP